MRGKSGVAAVPGESRNPQIGDIAWLSPEAELWVASSSTDFVGVIEFCEGHFVARDCRNRPLGTFSDLRRAKLAVNDQWESRNHLSLTDQLTGLASRLRSQSRAASPRLAKAGAETVA